ncbi:delta-60 repeat domain-containing protein [Desulfolithobacter sp.]
MLRGRLFCLCLLISLLVFIAHAARAGSGYRLDSSFGADGRIAVQLGMHGARAHAVVVQPDGKILLGGFSANANRRDFALVRFNPDGTLDREFNRDGMVLVPVAGGGAVQALALHADGSIVAGGYAENGPDRDFALICLRPDGSLDPGFGNQGLVINPVGNGDDEIGALAVDRKGSVLVAGTVSGTAGNVLAMARYRPDGRLDPEFGTQGMILAGAGRDALVQDLLVRQDGRLLVVGSFRDGNRTGVLLAGFLPDGRPDLEFGDQGKVMFAPHGEVFEGYGADLLGDGSILVAGSTGSPGERDAALFHFLADGRPDPLFGRNGVYVIRASVGDDVLCDLAVDTDRIAASGWLGVGSGRDFLLLTSTLQELVSRSPKKTGQYDKKNRPWLRIRELVVQKSLPPAFVPAAPEGTPFQIATTSFGNGEDIGYGVAVQPDGKLVVAGGMGTGENTEFALARYEQASIILKPADRDELPAAGAQNQAPVTGKDPSPDSNSMDYCFIATAAYGSLWHPYVSILRTFRDRYLLPNAPGRWLVQAYYHHSPALARVIAANPLLRQLTCVLLLPLVGFAWLLIHLGTKAFFVFLLLLAVRLTRIPFRRQAM